MSGSLVKFCPPELTGPRPGRLVHFPQNSGTHTTHSSYLRLESLEERRDISRHRLHHAEKPNEKYQMAACPEFPSSTLMASMGPRPSQRSDSKRVLKQKRTRTDNFYEGVHRRGVTQLCAHSGLRRVLCWETEAQPAFFFFLSSCSAWWKHLLQRRNSWFDLFPARRSQSWRDRPWIDGFCQDVMKLVKPFVLRGLLAAVPRARCEPPWPNWCNTVVGAPTSFAPVARCSTKDGNHKIHGMSAFQCSRTDVPHEKRRCTLCTTPLH